MSKAESRKIIRRPIQISTALLADGLSFQPRCFKRFKRFRILMDKEVVVLMYNGISLSHEINVIRLVAAR